MLVRVLIALSLIISCLALSEPSEAADPSGSLIIAGNGPEYRVIEQMARAF